MKREDQMWLAAVQREYTQAAETQFNERRTQFDRCFPTFKEDIMAAARAGQSTVLMSLASNAKALHQFSVDVQAFYGLQARVSPGTKIPDDPTKIIMADMVITGWAGPSTTNEGTE